MPLSDAPESRLPTRRRVSLPSAFAVSDPGALPEVSAEDSVKPELRLTKSVGALPSVDLSELTWRGSEWRWLNTVSFWLASTFAIGSILFIVGAAISLFKPFLISLGLLSGWKQRVLVDYVYAIGAIYFEVGAYLGYFEVINVGKAQRRLFAGPSQATSVTGYWASFLYFVGATSFGLPCFAMVLFPSETEAAVVRLFWMPQALGGVCFTAAAIFEFVHNNDVTWRHRVFWVCALYLAGSVLFLLAAADGLYLACARIDDEQLMQLGVDLPYLVGSACFLGGAWLQLQMWHAEQFGIGFIREINMTFHEHARPIKPTEELFLAIYAFNGALSAVNICLSLVWHRQEGCGESFGGWWQVIGTETKLRPHEELLIEMEELTSDATAFVAAHAMMLLATAVHFTPTLEPYGYLVKLMRALASLLLLAGLLRCVKLLLYDVISC